MICRDVCFANGLIMRAIGDTMVVAPPLIISRREIDELIDRVMLSLNQTRKRLK